MVEKRVLDNILANSLREDPSIRVISLIDKEGLPISFAIKSRKYKIKPQTLGSFIKQGFYPAENYALNLKLGTPLLELYIMQSASLLIVNLGVALLGINFDNSGWPLPSSLINNLLSQLLMQLRQAIKEESGLLSTITGMDKSGKKYELISDEKLKILMQIIGSFSMGNLKPILIKETAPAPEIFMNVAEKFDTFTVDSKGVILSMNPNYGPEFVACTNETLDIEINGLTVFKSGKVLCAFSYFEDKNCIANSVIGEYNSQNIYVFKKFPDWGVGFKTLITPFYEIANYLVADFASEESMDFIDVVIYLTDDVESLRERINSYIKENDLETARKFMERAALLYMRQKDYENAGDIFKWRGYYYYQEGKIKEAISDYELSAQYHKLANQLEKAGDDYIDIGNILTNSANVAEALEYYIKAQEIYEKLNLSQKADEIKNLKSNIIEPYKENAANFIKQTTGETLTIDYLARKLKLTEQLTITILKELIEEGVIGGEVDEARGRYTKVRISTKRPIVKPVQKPAMVNRKIIRSLDYSKIQPELANIENSLKVYEKEFEKRAIPFMKYLEYEKLLDQKQFFEHKRRILENENVFFKEDGSNQLCFICFQKLKTEDILSECPNGHKAHQQCLSIWIKSQDDCPVCDSPLFPFILKSSYLGVEGSTGTQEDNLAIINQMQARIAELEQENESLKKINASLKDLKGDSQDLAEKLIRERELKNKMEQELKRKDLTIRELKSMIKLFKQ
ncbi:MAG: RING finger domain-containing protein [Promethearchaeota archaeon]